MKASTHILRDYKIQRAIRKKSKSKHIYKKHVSHVVDLEIVYFVSNFVANTKMNLMRLKKIFNSKLNTRMVLSHTNLSTHKKHANALIRKYGQCCSEKLTTSEKKRA